MQKGSSMRIPQTGPEVDAGTVHIQTEALVHHHPSQDLYVIGITGTSGKTTTAYLIGEVLKTAGYKPFVLGSLNSKKRSLSTPEGPDIANVMHAHLKQGGTHFILEVTSEGIDQERIEGIDFDIKLLTNISQDHLDHHKTYQNYENAKLNFMRTGCAHKIYPENYLSVPIHFVPKMLGDFNLLNIQAAASALRHIGIEDAHINKTLATCLPPPGRMESVEMGQPYLVLVDYAHTPDGLENLLSTAKNLAEARNGQLLVLFGCGGNQDREKRPQMGLIAGNIADILVITDDNPRQEHSRTIMNEIVKGVDMDADNCFQIQNRRSAIKHIINCAQTNDVVVLAGKGHETSQITGSETKHFDDREEATNAITVRMLAGL
jgi:UDP-N-acetylmuramyl tripeptide synthase